MKRSDQGTLLPGYRCMLSPFTFPFVSFVFLFLSPLMSSLLSPLLSLPRPFGARALSSLLPSLACSSPFCLLVATEPDRQTRAPPCRPFCLLPFCVPSCLPWELEPNRWTRPCLISCLVSPLVSPLEPKPDRGWLTQSRSHRVSRTLAMGRDRQPTRRTSTFQLFVEHKEDATGSQYGVGKGFPVSAWSWVP